MKESTFRKPPAQEVREKQKERREAIEKIKDKDEERRLRKRLDEYFHPLHGWKGKNKSVSFWDRIRKQRRKKRKVSNMNKKENRIDKQKRKNRKRKKRVR